VFCKKSSDLPKYKKGIRGKTTKEKAENIIKDSIQSFFLHSYLKCGVPQGEAIISKLNEYE
jgi:hypothetical protein